MTFHVGGLEELYIILICYRVWDESFQLGLLLSQSVQPCMPESVVDLITSTTLYFCAGRVHVSGDLLAANHTMAAFEAYTRTHLRYFLATKDALVREQIED